MGVARLVVASVVAGLLAGCGAPAGNANLQIGALGAAHESGVPSKFRVRAMPYVCDFEREVGPEWSDNAVSVTPAGGRKFLGEFAGGKQVRLTLDSLAPHRYVRVEMELFIMHSWNGDQQLEPWSKEVIGPDTWSARVAAGPTLVSASFSTVSVGGLQYFTQSYPDETGAAAHPPRTAASESNTLGYTHFFGESEQLSHVPCDAVYKLAMIFPHDGRQLRLDFESVNVGNDGGATWGLDNVKVEILDKPPLPDPDEEEFNALWSALAGEDPVKASEATWRLAACGLETARRVSGRAGLTQPDAKRVTELVRQLDDDDWRQRESASAQLRKLGLSARPMLHKARERTNSAETRIRLDAILERLSAQGSLPTRRALRLLEIMREPAAPVTQ